MDRHPKLKPNNNVDTRIYHAMCDEYCDTFAELDEALRRYTFGKAHWGKKCSKRLAELLAQEADELT